MDVDAVEPSREADRRAHAGHGLGGGEGDAPALELGEGLFVRHVRVAVGGGGFDFFAWRDDQERRGCVCRASAERAQEARAEHEREERGSAEGAEGQAEHEANLPLSLENARKPRSGGLAQAAWPRYLGAPVLPDSPAPLAPSDASAEVLPSPAPADALPEATSTQPAEAPTASPRKRAGLPKIEHPLAIALLVTVMVTALSYIAPSKHAATVVGLAFLAWTRQLVLREDENVIRAHGLSLGGLLEPLPIEPRRMVREASKAALWALGLAALVFPFFWLGFKLFWRVKMPFVLRAPQSPLDEIAGQLLVVALPEEAFFRGYLQTRLDALWPPRFKILGAEVGLGLLVASAIFAVGHLLTTPVPARLAVFFPALVFGWLRARTKGIGAGVLFHALCNIFSATLARGYGLSP